MAKFNIANLTRYGGWNEVGRELLSSFDADWFKTIKSAEVTCKEQTWGESTAICLTLMNGQKQYLPLSSRSELIEGDKVDPKTIEIIDIEREGDEPTWRADGARLAV